MGERHHLVGKAFKAFLNDVFTNLEKRDKKRRGKLLRYLQEAGNTTGHINRVSTNS